MNTTLESNLQKAYSEAYRLAGAQIAQCNPEEVCQNSKAVFENATDTFTIRFFNTECRVNRGSGEVSLKDTPGELQLTEKVLILHYLIHAQPKPLTGQIISFREIAGGGSIYYPAFKKRTIDLLLKTFAKDVSALAQAAANLVGIPEKYGTVSSTLYAFPYVPITYVLWQGDTEIPASGAVLFDASVVSFLPVEDIVLAGSFGAYRLINEFRAFNS